MSGVPPARYAYLGPAGTFTEQALRSLAAAGRAELQPYPTVAAAVAAVRAGQADGAMVPFENSVEGSINATLDELATGEPLVITREAQLPVSLALLARAGVRRADVRRVGTHPHAEAQCRRWLATHLSSALVVHTPSTAAAAVGLLAESPAYDAAVAAPIAAERYRLRVLESDINDVAGAETRFVLVSRPGPPPAPTGDDKTSLVAFIRDDRPGALLEVLTEFAVRGVNLARIESRPTGDGIGRYCFSIDCAGHVADAPVGEALMGLRRVCADVRFLGSYPRAVGSQPLRRPGEAEAEFRDSRAWLERIRSGGA